MSPLDVGYVTERLKVNNIDCFVYLFFPIFELLKVNTTFIPANNRDRAVGGAGGL